METGRYATEKKGGVEVSFDITIETPDEKRDMNWLRNMVGLRSAVEWITGIDIIAKLPKPSYVTYKDFDRAGLLKDAEDALKYLTLTNNQFEWSVFIHTRGVSNNGETYSAESYHKWLSEWVELMRLAQHPESTLYVSD